MTHAEKLVKKAQLEADLETAMALSRAQWQSLSRLLEGLTALQSSNIVDAFLEWMRLDEEANDALDKLHRLNDRITKQMQFPTTASHPATIAGPPTSMRTLTSAKSVNVK